MPQPPVLLFTAEQSGGDPAPMGGIRLGGSITSSFIAPPKGLDTGVAVTGSNVTSLVTPSWTPNPNSLYLLAVISKGTSPLAAPTVSGNGMTWWQVSYVDANNRRLTVFRAMSAAPLTGATTINLGATLLNNCSASIAEFQNVDTSGTDGSGAIVQGNNNFGSGTVATVTLNAFANAAMDAVYLASSHNIGAADTVPEAGYTELTQGFYSGGDTQHATAWKLGEDLSATCSWPTTTNWRAIAIEIKTAAVPPPVYTDAPSGGLVLGGSVSQAQTWPTATPSGGIILGGSTVYGLVRAALPSGGILLGGSVVQDITRAVLPSGGIVLGGSVIQSIVRAVLPSGGIVLGGTAAIATTWPTATPSGVITLGGTCSSTLTSGSSVTPTGGILLGGSVVQAITRAVLPSGGIVLGGSTSIATTWPTCAPSGGIVLGGSVTRSLVYAVTLSGGILLGGTCTSSASTIVNATRVVGKPKLRLKPGPVAAAKSGGCAIVGTFKVGENTVGCNWVVRKPRLRLKAQGYVIALGAPPRKERVNKSRLMLKGKLVTIYATQGVTLGAARLRLKGRYFQAIEPDHQSPLKPRLYLKSKPLVLKMTQKYTVGKAPLILHTKPIARAGLAGLLVSPPKSVILTPNSCDGDGTILTPTVPKSTLLVPTAPRSI